MSIAVYILAILLGIVLIYSLINYLLSPRPPSRIGPEQISLSTQRQIISSEELKIGWSSTSGSTLFFYINPTIKDRTSISGNEYAKAVQIGSKQTLKILVAADAGRGYANSPATLEVFVKNNPIPEIIEIPNISLQKWSAVAIVKQGRKFNIYINGKLMVSHVCTAMPDFDETQPLRTGDARLGGSIALMSLAPYPMNIDDVRSMVSSTSGTDGAPYISSGIFSFIPTFSVQVNLCPGGNCNSTKTSGSPGPLNQWTTPYA